MNAIFQTTLDWISKQHREMVQLLTTWANINSGTDNVEGLSKMAEQLRGAFAPLDGAFSRISLPARHKINSAGDLISIPQGDALLWRKRPEASKRIFLGGHMDTVFSQYSPFQTTTMVDSKTMRGPGVTDMKGGLVILLYCLLALEQSPFGSSIGWEVLINPDEEVGSPGSSPLFTQSAKRNLLGLLFEPSFPDGNLVSSRKGSANFSLISRGRAAHAGRDFFQGRNAILALAKVLLKTETLTDAKQGITVNVGKIEGGAASNIVPDLAIARVNVRAPEQADLKRITDNLKNFAQEMTADGIQMTIYEDANTPPKPFDHRVKTLFSAFRTCAEELDLNLACKPSGGSCDGCRLYADGLPNIDTLGAVGGNIHTEEEFIHLDSLVERTRLTTLFLLNLAKGNFEELIKEIADGSTKSQ